MKLRFIMLTKSSKHGKYCVAGIDASSGEWIRLVTVDEDTDGAVAEGDLEYADGRIAEILDEMEVDAEPYPDEVQPENMLMDSYSIPVFVRHHDFDDVLRIHPPESDKYIFFTKYRSVKPEYIKDPKSLMLVKVDNLAVKRASGKTTRDIMAVASFLYGDIEYEDINVTDPLTYQIVDHGGIIRDSSAYLVVSLGKPFLRDKDGRKACYKFVAKIFHKEDR